MRDSEDIICGRNSVLEAIRKGNTVDKILIVEGRNEGAINTIIREAKKNKIIIEFTGKKVLDGICDESKHQGVAAYISPYEYVEVDDILEIARKKGEDPFIILLDEIEDPHNLGAIIRTANMCGAHGVIIPKRRAARLTSIVAKTSAGAINYTPVAK
nr:RNA methyltransferase [Lachnospiraceae bacterium]